MKSRARAFGHPIHPMLVALPIGLWLVALGFDCVYLWRRDTFWYRLSFWNMVAGITGALVAAVPGFIDYVSIPDSHPASRTATAHFSVVLGVIALYTINVYLRYDHASAQGWPLALAIALSVIGVTLLGLAGWAASWSIVTPSAWTSKRANANEGSTCRVHRLRHSRGKQTNKILDRR